MKINLFFAFLLAAFLGVGCSNDHEDDDPIVENLVVEDNILGSWRLLSYHGGYGGISETLKASKCIVSFTKDSIMQVTNEKNLNIPFLSTGKYGFSFVDIEDSIFTGKPAKVLLIDDFHYFFYSIKDGQLTLSQEAFDGFSFIFEKI